MKRKYGKFSKTEIDQEIFGNLTEIKDFEAKYQSFILQKTQPNIYDKNTNRVKQTNSDLEYHSFLLDKIVRKSFKSKDLTLECYDICQEFGIDFHKVQQLETLEQKQNYVVECSNLTIHNSLDQILKKYQEKSTNNDITNGVNQINDNKKQLDIFSWIKIKTQYSNLKRILEYSLVELVQEQNNSNKIKTFFQNLDKFAKRHKTTESTGINTTLSSRAQGNLDQEKIFLDIQKLEFDVPDLTFFEWNQAIEEGYIKCNKNLHIIGHEQLKKHNLMGKHHIGRDKLLEKCTQGNYITPEELKYLSSTSYLINKCMDKQFIQRAINFLDNEVIHQIEMNIAEQILYSYYSVKQSLTKYRQNWLSKLNKIKRFQINKKSQSQAKQQNLASNSSQIRQLKKKIINQLKEVAKKRQLNIQAERSKQRYLRQQRKNGNPLANIYVQRFKEIVLQVISKIRQKKTSNKDRQKEFLMRNEGKPSQKPIYKTGIDTYDLEHSKRAFHPPSKLMTCLSEDKLNIVTAQEQELIQRRFKIGMKNSIVEKELFSEFYTGGPQLERDYKSPQLTFLNKKDVKNQCTTTRKQRWITPQIEIQAANKIKIALKRYIQNKALNKLIKKTEIKKNRDIEIKIKKCLEAKSFFEQLHRELDKRQSEKLKDISVFQPPKVPEFQSSTKKVSEQCQSGSQSQRNYVRRETQKCSIAKLIIPEQNINEINNHEVEDGEDTVRKVKQEIQEIARKKKMMKFSKQKEISEAKLKNRKLIVAAKMKNLQIALTSGFSYNQKDTSLQDRYGNTPLYYCAKNGDEQFCKFLLNLGASVNQACENLNTPLHMAFKSENTQIIIDFIQHGGNLNQLNADKFTPLAFASESTLKQLHLFKLIATSKISTLQFDNHSVFIQQSQKQQNIDNKYEETLEYDYNRFMKK